MIASIIAIAQLSANIIATVRGYYGSVVDARENISRLHSELEGLKIVLESLQDMITSSRPANLLPTLTASEFLIEDCKRIMTKVAGKLGTPERGLKFGARLAWPLKEKDIEKLATAIARQRGVVAAALGKDQMYVHTSTYNSLVPFARF